MTVPAKKRDAKLTTQSLAAVCPPVAAQWHPTLNGDLTPAGVFAMTNKKYWFQCARGADHTWESSPNNRVHGKGCPFCAGLKLSVTNCLTAVAPSAAAEWHPTKNGDTAPTGVLATSRQKAWFKCDQGADHEWQAPVYSRAQGGSSCPCCKGRQASVTNSLEAVAPDIACQWHPTRNGSVLPSDVRASSFAKYWFQCPVARDHEWQASLYKRVNGDSGCPCCSGRRVSVTNSLATVAPAVAAQWHPTLNRERAPQGPEGVVANTNAKFWFACENGPDHVWEAIVRNRVAGKTGCPFCASRRLSVTNCLQAVAPEVAQQWHPTRNGETTPADVFPRSKARYWFLCDRGADHEWQGQVNARVAGKGECPFCAGRKACSTNSLAALKAEAAELWDDDANHPLAPEQVLASSRQKYAFVGQDGLRFTRAPADFVAGEVPVSRKARLPKKTPAPKLPYHII
jgi:hypothetical protein